MSGEINRIDSQFAENMGKFHLAEDYESKLCIRLFGKYELRIWLIHN
jgi:hypothetical protein